MKKWIKGFFKKENMNITDRALELIIDLKGLNTRAVNLSLEKILLYAAGVDINVETVEKAVGRSVTESVFKLVDAINEGNGKWAFRILGDLYSQKKQPAEIIGYLSWYIKTLKNIKRLAAKKYNLNQISSEIGYSPSYIRRLEGQSRKYSRKKIEDWSFSLFNADHDIKNGIKRPDIAIDTLIASLIS